MHERVRHAAQSGLIILAVSLVTAVTLPPCGAAQVCENGNFDSTFALIQAAIFERHGCTSAVCHGATPGSGGLDLRPDVAYDNLVDVPAQTPPTRVYRM